MRKFNVIYRFAYTLIVAALFTGCNKYKVVSHNDAILYIRPGATYSQVEDSLKKALDNPEPFLKYAKGIELQSNFKSGRYKIPAGTKSNYLGNMLSHGWQQPVNLVLAGNIRGMERLAGKLGGRLGYDSAAFVKEFLLPDKPSAYGFTKETFPCMIIPNTYEVYWNISPNEFMQRMKEEYDKFWNESRLGKAKAIGLSPVEVSILASIICEETNYKPEMPRIAGVYINRLKKGLKLEACPTIKYALNDFTLRRILYVHLEVDSPYNTYKNEGLPPGPITIPTIASIDAVLNYEQHNYMFFCASDKLDGTHLFAKTGAEHGRNARAYQAAISRSAR